jgi:hypothetical protein
MSSEPISNADLPSAAPPEMPKQDPATIQENQFQTQESELKANSATTTNAPIGNSNNRSRDEILRRENEAQQT